MSEGFYDLVNGTGRTLQKAWDNVSGVAMLKKRGIEGDSYDAQIGCLMFGFFSGVIGGLATGMATDSLIASLAVAGVGISMPVTGFLPYAVYKSGEHDKMLRLEHEKYKQLEAPKAQLPPPGPEPLI